jgi:hypothetical protein
LNGRGEEFLDPASPVSPEGARSPEKLSKKYFKVDFLP